MKKIIIPNSPIAVEILPIFLREIATESGKKLHTLTMLSIFILSDNKNRLPILLILRRSWFL